MHTHLDTHLHVLDMYTCVSCVSHTHTHTHTQQQENDSVSMTTFITETSATDTAATAESLERSEIQNELQLRDHQIARLLELLAQQMIQDTSKRLAKQHHLMLNERERDEATLPLDLWKTNVSIDIPLNSVKAIQNMNLYISHAFFLYQCSITIMLL